MFVLQVGMTSFLSVSCSPPKTSFCQLPSKYTVFHPRVRNCLSSSFKLARCCNTNCERSFPEVACGTSIRLSTGTLQA